jgi:hypothetical protein
VADWFRSLDMLPPFRVQVRVQWKGRIFNALRTVHPKKRVPVWVTLHGGEIVYLPPKGRSRSWGEEPELWQPLDPTDWPHDLPEPVRETGAVAWRSHVDEATDEPLTNDHWWRDITLMRYSPKGEISLQEAEGRVMRAICTGWTINLGGPALTTNASIISRLSETRSQLETEFDHVKGHHVVASRDWRPPFRPTGVDRDDFLVASAWFAALHPPELWHKEKKTGSLSRGQSVLVSRAMDPPLPWVFLGQRYSVTDERVRQIYKQSVERVWRAANGLPVFKHLKPADQMQALRTRNKAHRHRD